MWFDPHMWRSIFTRIRYRVDESEVFICSSSNWEGEEIIGKGIGRRDKRDEGEGEEMGEKGER